MSKAVRQIVLLLLCLLVAGVVVSVVLSGPKGNEPSYQGRKLRDWLSDYDPSVPQETRAQTDDAIRHMGTNTIPWLIERICFRDDHILKQVSRAVFNKARAVNTTNRWELIDQAERRAFQASMALAALGTQAEGAIGELTKVIDGPYAGGTRTARSVIYALSNLGPKALTPLMRTFTNQNAFARDAAVHWIGNLGTNASPAVPALVGFLDNMETRLAIGAAFSLGEIHMDSATAVPALANALTTGTYRVGFQAATSLGKFGTNARSATPALLTACNHRYDFMRQAATNALLKIAPEALTNAPPR